MTYPLACADFTFPLLEHENSLRLLGMLGFQGVDIGLFEGRSRLQPAGEFRNAVQSGRQLKKKAQRYGLAIADVFLQTAPDFFSLAPNHPLPARRTKARTMFLKTLEYAAAAEAHHVSALPGIYFKDESKMCSWQRCIDELSWRVEQAKAFDLVFGVEAHIGSVASQPKDVLRLIKDVPGLTLTLDYTHFVRKGIPASEIEPLLPYASHFHLRGAKKNRLQTSFQDNQIDYARVLEMMLCHHYQGYIGIEYVWIDWEHCNEVDNLSETILWKQFLLRTFDRLHSSAHAQAERR